MLLDTDPDLPEILPQSLSYWSHGQETVHYQAPRYRQIKKIFGCCRSLAAASLEKKGGSLFQFHCTENLIHLRNWQTAVSAASCPASFWAPLMIFILREEVFFQGMDYATVAYFQASFQSSSVSRLFGSLLCLGSTLSWTQGPSDFSQIWCLQHSQATGPSPSFSRGQVLSWRSPSYNLSLAWSSQGSSGLRKVHLSFLNHSRRSSCQQSKLHSREPSLGHCLGLMGQIKSRHQAVSSSCSSAFAANGTKTVTSQESASIGSRVNRSVATSLTNFWSSYFCSRPWGTRASYLDWALKMATSFYSC